MGHPKLCFALYLIGYKSKIATVKKNVDIKIVYNFETTCQGCIYLIKKYSKNCYNVKYYYNLRHVFYFNIFQNIIYSCDCKAEFSASLLQSSVSHDPSELILICRFSAQETFLIWSLSWWHLSELQGLIPLIQIEISARNIHKWKNNLFFVLFEQFSYLSYRPNLEVFQWNIAAETFPPCKTNRY